MSTSKFERFWDAQGYLVRGKANFGRKKTIAVSYHNGSFFVHINDFTRAWEKNVLDWSMVKSVSLPYCEFMELMDLRGSVEKIKEELLMEPPRLAPEVGDENALWNGNTLSTHGLTGANNHMPLKAVNTTIPSPIPYDVYNGKGEMYPHQPLTSSPRSPRVLRELPRANMSRAVDPPTHVDPPTQMGTIQGVGLLPVVDFGSSASALDPSIGQLMTEDDNLFYQQYFI